MIVKLCNNRDSGPEVFSYWVEVADYKTLQVVRLVKNLLQRLCSKLELGARDTLSFLVSLTLHIMMLLGLALWVFVVGKDSSGILVTAHIGDSAETVLDLGPTTKLDETNIDASSSFESLFKQSEFEFKTESLSTNEGATDASQIAGALTSTGLRTISEELDTRGLGRGASFFGTYAQGGRFVYVIDSSQSMKGDRWAVARQKLIESLRSLGKDQEFFVICFDEHASLLFNCQPKDIEFKKVNDVIIERVSRWLRSRTLGPATMPAEALQYALAMRPDAIFILSDGELQDDSIQMLRMTNVSVGSKQKIPIHAIHLISQQGMSTLKQLADDNGGSFRHVSR